MTSNCASNMDHAAKKPKYKRVVLKLSGESFAGGSGFGIDLDVVNSMARQIKDVFEKQVEMAIVVGGGISGAEHVASKKGWTAPRQTIWACLRQS